jgi:hypothetical protein
LRAGSGNSKKDAFSVEEEIPFWAFLDIEYNRNEITFYLRAYWTMRPAFVNSLNYIQNQQLAILHRLDDVLKEKPSFRIQKTDWKSRDKLPAEVLATNVFYMLIDTKDKLLYIGEALNLVSRLN